jgi:hypothetical protein
MLERERLQPVIFSLSRPERHRDRAHRVTREWPTSPSQDSPLSYTKLTGLSLPLPYTKVEEDYHTPPRVGEEEELCQSGTPTPYSQNWPLTITCTYGLLRASRATGAQPRRPRWHKTASKLARGSLLSHQASYETRSPHQPTGPPPQVPWRRHARRRAEAKT